MTSHALTDLNYHLGQSKYGKASISEQSFHGSRSAELSVSREGSYIRISVYADDPIPVRELDRLGLWVNPQEGDGELQLEIFLDGDGDGRYSSRSPVDARIRSIRETLSEMGMDPESWGS